MRPQSAKAKGRRLQQRVAADIVAALGLEPDDVVSRSSGANGTDVMLSPAARRVFPYAVECKCVEALNVWASMQQACSNCPPESTPLLIVSRNKTEPLAVLPWTAFLKLAALKAIL